MTNPPNTGRALSEARALLQEVCNMKNQGEIAETYASFAVTTDDFDKLESRINAWLKQHPLPTCEACKGGGIQADGPCACQQPAPTCQGMLTECPTCKNDMRKCVDRSKEQPQ